MSNMSSFAGETVMTEMDETDYVDEDRAIIYQVVDDMIKITEAQELILKNKIWAKTNNLISPERQVRKGMDLNYLNSQNISLEPFNSPTEVSPFAHYNRKATLAQSMSLEDRHKVTDESIKDIFTLKDTETFTNIGESFIEQIHHR